MEQETYKRARSFSFQKAFLSEKNYKVCFLIAVFIVLCDRIFRILRFEESLQTGGYSITHVIIFMIFMMIKVIMIYALFLLPVVFMLRIILTRRLKLKIEKLEEAIFIGEKINHLRNALSQECEGEK